MTMTHQRRAPERMTVAFSDGGSTGLVVFRGGEADAPVVLCLPAMGVRAGYYAAVGAELAERGFTAVLADLRGNGGSSVRPSRATTFGYVEMLETELPEILEAVRREFGVEQVAVLGHSLGGHLGVMLAATSPHVSHIVLVATGTSWYRRVAGIRSMGRFLGLQLIFATTLLHGYLPDWLPFAGKEARGVIRDWGHDAMTGRYRIARSSVDYERALAESTVPALFVVLPEDRYVPESCSEHLAAKLRSAEVAWTEIPPEHFGLEKTHHFRWAHRPGALVDATVQWLESTTRRA
ncbi:alpha/beta fold hydrolase [Sphaerisporangium flaviroseum]|uniref:Alpha/beta fold hydrolase n=1 Tax=Sphaerisporangium flaviroseum TaxID=509199 RepID=A0ABP7IEM6_9ACTN